MKAIVFTTPTSRVQALLDIFPIKGCYLLADRVMLSGQIAADLSFEKEYRQFKMDKMKRYIQNGLNVSSVEDKEPSKQYLETIILGLKQMNAIKHPTQQVIVEIKKQEKSLRTFLNEFMEIYSGDLSKSGMNEISYLADRDTIQTSLIEMSSGESLDIEGINAAKKAESVLELLFPSDETEEPQILALSTMFMCNDYLFEGEPILPRDENLFYEVDSFYHLGIKIPCIDRLTALELKVLRNQLREDGNLFRLEMDEWIQFCRVNKDYEKQIAILKDEIIGNMDTFQKAIDMNQMIIDINQQSFIDTKDYHVYVGVAPLKFFWKYYERFNILDEETISILRTTTLNNHKYPQTIPYMSFLTSYRNEEEMKRQELDREEDGLVLIKKKSISAD